MAAVIGASEAFHINIRLHKLWLVGPTVVEESKINKKTREAHRALQGGLVDLGQALAQGSSPAELRELAASRGLHVHDPLRVGTSNM